MKREILFEYGFQSVNGIVKKVYAISEIPNIAKKCDVWNVLPIVYVRQFTGLTDKNGVKIFEGDVCEFIKDGFLREETAHFSNGCFNLGECMYLAQVLIDKYIEVMESIEVIGNIHETKKPCNQ